MDIPASLQPIWDQLAAMIAEVPQSGLLIAALAAMLLGLLGSLVVRRVPVLGKTLRLASTLTLVGVLLLVVLQVSRMDGSSGFAVPSIGLPEQVVEGGETRVPLSRDGHYWIEAEVNGHPTRFLVDTGATLTAISEETAQAAGLEPRSNSFPVRLQTANGQVSAQMTTLDELRFGNVAARGLDAVIAPNIGPTNVLGMNLLSRLKGWGVEDGVLILRPNNPQPELVVGE
ncbi:retropepsin-like aspartic protease family protein [Paraurantiacibacter namhicola]|nr:TIGR02281 family clan AA aspartic protease [Paraurantiacibacter namhicola]